MTRPMNQAERDAFLRDAKPGILAIPVAGRGPLCAPVWFDFTPGGPIWFLIQKESRKGRLIEAGTRLSLCVQRDTPPYKYVTVEGPVTDIAPYDLETDLRAMAVRYLGAEGGTEFVETMRPVHAGGGGIKVSMTPRHWLSSDYEKN